MLDLNLSGLCRLFSSLLMLENYYLEVKAK